MAADERVTIAPSASPAGREAGGAGEPEPREWKELVARLQEAELNLRASRGGAVDSPPATMSTLELLEERIRSLRAAIEPGAGDAKSEGAGEAPIGGAGEGPASTSSPVTTASPDRVLIARMTEALASARARLAQAREVIVRQQEEIGRQHERVRELEQRLAATERDEARLH